MKRGSFDFETYEWVKPRCLGLMWGDEWVFIEHPTAHFDIAKQGLLSMYTIAESQGVWEWWGHNAGKYDSLFMLAAAEDLGWEAQGIITGGRLISLKVRPHGNRKFLQLNDSMAVVQSSLGDAASDFELEDSKLFTKEDYSQDVRTWDRQRLEDGCKVDCKLVLQLLNKVETLVTQWGGQMRLTFSSIALSVVKANVELASCPYHANLIGRNAYIGGRVEVFHHAPQYELTEWDITSSYPWSMTQDLPWEFQKQVITEKQSFKAMMEESAIVYARVSVPDLYVPPLPYRHDKGGIYFPTGEWDAWFTSVELRHAIKHGVKVRPLHAHVFSTESPFKDFVARVFRTKQTAKGALRNFSKLVLNGCYGKFAQKPEREMIEVMANDELAFEAIMKALPGTLRMLSNFSPRYLARVINKWPKQTHYPLASFITAHSRILLHDLLAKAKGLAYTDTDSIHASSESVFDEGNELGQLKVEIPSMFGEYFAAKLYRLRATGKLIHASKGFEVTEETFNKTIKGEEIFREQMRLAKGMLREGMKLKVTRPKTSRKWQGLSMKRALMSDGDTRPWKISELKLDKHLSSISFHHPSFRWDG